MQIVVNGQTRDVGSACSVLELVRHVSGRDFDEDAQPLDGQPVGLAVARRSVIIPRSAWAATSLGEGDVVDIVTAVQGG